ncbi:MAG: DNA sulfur modification protein DndD [Pyrinomonadaceae bacterium]
MKILGLTVYNFGVFRGRHHFDFTPTIGSKGTRQHLTAISGANGVGKSTLFQAMSLALHGALSLRDRVSRHDYQNFLLSRLHRSNDLGLTVLSGEAYVSLNFEYVKSGKLLHVEVKRQWYLEGSKVSEELTVLCNGQPPDVTREDEQHWLNELIPPGMSPLCFFDAEKLEDFASAEQPDSFVRDALQRLLGLDLVDKLLADLDRYSTLRGGGNTNIKGLQQQSRDQKRSVDELDEEIGGLREEVSVLEKEGEQLRGELTAQEGYLAAEGGSYAEQRKALQERLAHNQREAERVFAQIETLCNELLPFCLVPELCRQLEQRLLTEASLQRQEGTSALWQERVEALQTKLQADKFWKGLELSPQARKTLTKRLLKELSKELSSQADETRGVIHSLAVPERERMLGWIEQALRSVPAQVKQLGAESRALQQEEQQLKQDLKRAPEDDVLKPIQQEIERLQSELQKLQSQNNARSEKIGSLQYQRDEHERQRQRFDEQLSQARANEQRLIFAERSKKVLLDYKSNLLKQRIASLQEHFLASFNRLCRKGHLLSAVTIDPETFRIELHGTNDGPLNVTELSAGERQLYALAWLQSLRQVSGRQLPLVIDTPLARLDEHHRARLVNNYFPEVSEQVLLFATTAELDADLLLEMKPMLARLYELRQDAEARESSALCFSTPPPREVLLYRAETNGKSNSKAGKFLAQQGQYWYYEADAALQDGKSLVKAKLPESARRLEIVDANGGYNWLQVAELAQAVEDRFLFAALRNGHHIFDLWHDDWSEPLRSAGYDSIATLTAEGPVEYVLETSKLIVLERVTVDEKSDDLILSFTTEA